jgi:serine phosphatase RsbU (regulator of sigma subunit)
MKYKITLILLLFLKLSIIVGKAQSLSDSLLKVWNNKSLHDTTRIKAVKQLAWQCYAFTNTDTAEMYAQMGYNFAQQKGNKKYMSILLNTLGSIAALKGNYSAAIIKFQQALDIQYKVKDYYGLAKTYNNMGYIYRNQGKFIEALDIQLKSMAIQEKYHYADFKLVTIINIGITYQEFYDYPSALKYYLKGLKLAETLKDTMQIADIQNNIGLIYVNQKEYQRALKLFTSNNTIFKKSKNNQRMASTYLNIGLCYMNLMQADSALSNYNNASLYYQKVGDKPGMIKALNNMGFIFKTKKELDKALTYYQKSLDLSELTESKKDMANVMGNIGYIYKQQHLQLKAKTHLEAALKFAKESGSIEEISYAASYLWDFYKSINDYQSALKMYELYVQMKDSISSDEKQKELIKATTKFIYEKKAAADSVANAKQIEIKNIELNKQSIQIKAKRNQQIALFFGLFIVLIFSGFLYNRFKITQKQKAIIENAHQALEVKSKEILDSIVYSKRIQKAILPPERLIKEYLNDAFVLYIPKDIVAGDFYWIDKVKDSVYIAACDCTGHGVPGALVSVVCNNALNRAVNEFSLRLTGQIFDKTRDLVLESFAKSDDEVKDGMDASLACLNIADNTLLWSGANNPLWIYRNNSNAIEEIKPDKQPIGVAHQFKPFTTHQIELNKNDIIYLFTDGYADQFGGQQGKKLMKAKLRDFILLNAKLNMDEQYAALLKFHHQFKGNNEQVDDICIIGVKV